MSTKEEHEALMKDVEACLLTLAVIHYEEKQQKPKTPVMGKSLSFVKKSSN